MTQAQGPMISRATFDPGGHYLPMPPVSPDTPLQAAIRAFMKRSGKSARAISLEAGMSETGVKAILAGRSRSPRGENLHALARVIEANPAKLVGDDEGDDAFFAPNVRAAPDLGPLQPRRIPARAVVPVMGTAAGGEDGFFEINLTDGPVEYIDLPPGLSQVEQGDLFAIRVHGESMEPVWEAGDPVFIVKSRPLKRGAFAVILLERGRGDQPRALLKQFVRQDDERVALAQFNPAKEVIVPREQVRNIWRACHWRELVER